MSLPDKLMREFDELVSHYPQKRAALIPALHRCQEELGGWITPQIMEDLAEYFELEPVEVYGVASFYPMFHLKPVGRHVVSVCRNISCDLRGADDVLSAVCKKTGAKVGGNSSDLKYYVEVVECQGACAAAPMMVVDGVFHENLTTAEVERVLGGLQ